MPNGYRAMFPAPLPVVAVEPVEVRIETLVLLGGEYEGYAICEPPLQ
jgi:hypothetical protein